MGKTVGVIIARFQVPELTDGHIALIDHVKHTSEITCILLGVSKIVDLRNPLSFEMREQMVRANYPDLFHVHPLQDVPGQDAQWSWTIDKFLSLLFPNAEIKLYGGRKSFKRHYLGRHRPVTEFPSFDTGTSGTRVRSEIVAGTPHPSELFRSGVIYAVGNYVQTQLSVPDRQLQGVPLEAATPEHDNHL